MAPQGAEANCEKPAPLRVCCALASSENVGGKRSGGEGGIRTHGTLSRTHAFQACALSHSATSPVGPSFGEASAVFQVRTAVQSAAGPRRTAIEPFATDPFSIGAAGFRSTPQD